jgi:proprotein convertase subtilisin/kexin type 5
MGVVVGYEKASKCTACQNGRSPTPTCDCPDGTYDDGVSSDCGECSFRCETCETTADYCKICKSNRIEEPECICAEGFYEIANESECMACHRKCKKCVEYPDCGDYPDGECASDRVQGSEPLCPCPLGEYENSQHTCSVCDV